MILGGEQRDTGQTTTSGGSSPAWDLTDQQGRVWALLQRCPHVREIALPAAVLVEGWVSA